MILITGGAFQGKTDYVMKNYNIFQSDIKSGKIMSLSEYSEIKCINNFHILIKRLLDNFIDPIKVAKDIIMKNPEIIIIINDIGNGIVPIEKSERIWREQVGKTGCYLAKKSDEVIRIICGCAVKIKSK